MEKNYYYIQRYDTKEDIEVGKNKREAIKQGKEIALKYRTSCTLLKCVEDEGSLCVTYVGILEFPYYLRNCQLDTSDITVNLL